MAIMVDNTLALCGGQALAADLEMPPWPPVSENVAQQLAEVYRSRKWSFGGPHEVAFARDYAAAHDASEGIFMANGTVTLQCALGAYGIGAGDEVIVPALTWIATAMAPLYLGATPVFVDVEPSTLCLDPAAFEATITEKTRAVIPVHLYGSMADLEKILEIAHRHNLVVIEDCAHAQGGKWNGRGLGSWGHVGSFSFQESKTVASGEGGICITNDSEIAERIYRMKHIGYASGTSQGKSSVGPPPGLLTHNFRATEFQAVILQDQLLQMDQLMATYQRNATYLEKRIAEIPGFRVQSRGRLSTRQNYYAFAVVCDEGPLKDVPLATIQRALHAEGLPVGGTYGVVYKHILFNQPGTAYRITDGGCPIAEKIGTERTLQFIHCWLGADDATIEAMSDIFAKVGAHADELKRLG